MNAIAIYLIMTLITPAGPFVHSVPMNDMANCRVAGDMFVLQHNSPRADIKATYICTYNR